MEKILEGQKQENQLEVIAVPQVTDGGGLDPGTAEDTESSSWPLDGF